MKAIIERRPGYLTQYEYRAVIKNAQGEVLETGVWQFLKKHAQNDARILLTGLALKA